MSRTRRAAIAAAFGYGQFGVSLVVGIVVVPILLDRLGARTWGLWLATGELLAYAGMVDLGVLGVLPWLVAEADGGGDRAAMRRLMSTGVALGSVIGLAFGVFGFALWEILPSVLRLSQADRAAVGAPLALIVGATALTYPLRVYPAVLMGLQDMTFFGALRVGQSVLNAVLTILLLQSGYGLYALAWASVVPTIAGLVVAMLRLRTIAPDLTNGWVRPVWSQVSAMLMNGFGVWLAAFGWLLLSSSNALVITFLGHPEWVAIFSCTAKVSLIATQLVWMMPDAGLVGLAQLHGQVGASPRLRHLVGLLQQVHLLLAGAAACAVLAFNPTFVNYWVGPSMFGGLTLNVLLGCGIVLSSLVHGLVTAASALGRRVEVGFVTLCNGVVQVAAAVALGRWLGLLGIVLAGLIAAGLTSLPGGLILLGRRIGLSATPLLRECVMPWAVRAIPLVAAAIAVGALHAWLGFWLAGAATFSIGVAYVWQMRPLYGAMLALDARWSRWLTMARLVPLGDAPSAPMPAVNQP